MRVEERLEHDVCMTSFKQGTCPLIESIVSRLEKLARVNDGKGQQKWKEKLPLSSHGEEGRTERALKYPYALSVVKPATIHGDAPLRPESNRETRNPKHHGTGA